MLHSVDTEQLWTLVTRRAALIVVQLEEIDLRLHPRLCAEQLGWTSRVELDRYLRDLGLPRFRLLRDGYYVYRIYEEARRHGSLSHWSFSHGSYPQVYYRFVERAVGRRWSVIEQLTPREVRRVIVDYWLASGMSAVSGNINDARKSSTSRGEFSSTPPDVTPGS